MLRIALAWAVLVFLSAAAQAQPAPIESDWVAHDFHFHDGQVLPELRIHYATLGAPTGEPVVVLHGTGGTGMGLLAPGFGGVLFGPGQPLDASRYFIILPDAIGHGGSSKPSDGLRARFPGYDYADMVEAQHRLLTEGLGVPHARLVLGNSMGGMEVWVWAEAHPGFADAWVPMGSQPTAMASRNWMMRRMLIEEIRQDPAYMGGDYVAQPPSLRLANVMFGIATSGGTLGWQAQAPTTAKADQLVARMLAAPPPPDANDAIYQWYASRDFDASAGLDRITGRLLVINSADDERNPPESGIMDREMARLPGAEYDLIPASAETRGHGTTGMARFWAERLRAFLAALPAQ